MEDNKIDANDRAFARRMNDEAEEWAYPLAPDAISAESTVADIIAANKAARAARDTQHGV
jgi:hypothetical protein